MKVLLTGANGFVGSHILDSLRARDIATAILLRPGSSRRLIGAQLAGVEVRAGSLDDAQSMGAALEGVTHVIHCAGATKALRVADFYEVNQAGTQRLMQAVGLQGQIQRFVPISSLAAGGPALPQRPAREDDTPNPVSEYGRSKLAGEREALRAAGPKCVILRPPAVYGPRDAEFLRLFKAVKAHLSPRMGPQPLSFVFVKDLAEASAACLTHPAAAGKIFNVASPEIVTAGALAKEIASQMKTWTLPLPVPAAALWCLCCLQDAASRLTGRPGVLGRQKYAELRAPGWVCDSSRIRRELGFACATNLKDGIAETLAWYRKHAWL